MDGCDQQICPHCAQPGITLRAKRRASKAWPAVCSHCGGLSYISTPVFHWCLALFQMPLAIVWLIGIAVTATKWMLLLPVVLGGPLVALFWINGAVEERARLRSIAPEQSRRSRIWFYVWAAVFFSILLLSWILAG